MDGIGALRWVGREREERTESQFGTERRVGPDMRRSSIQSARALRLDDEVVGKGIGGIRAASREE